MIVRTLVCALLLVLVGARIEAAGPPAFVDPDPRVRIHVRNGGSNENPYWDPPNANNESHTTAERLVRELIRENPSVRRAAGMAAFWIDRYHAGPGPRPAVSASKALHVVLDMSTAAGSAGYMRISFPRIQGQTFLPEAHIQIGAAGLAGLLDGDLASAKKLLAELVLHEFDHVALTFAEADYNNRNAGLPRSKLTEAPGLGKKHDPTTVYDNASAPLVEGIAGARQLYAFMHPDAAPPAGTLLPVPSDSYLYKYFEKRFFEQPMWEGFIKELPPGKRELVERARRAKDPAGAVRKGRAAIYELKSLEEMVRTEGVVELVIYDLLADDLILEEHIHEALSRGKRTNVLELVDGLIDVLGNTPEAATAVRKVVARRLLGMNINQNRAQALYRKLLDGMPNEEFIAELDKFIDEEGGKKTGKVASVGGKKGKKGKGKGTLAGSSRPSEILQARVGRHWSIDCLKNQAAFIGALYISNLVMAVGGWATGKDAKNPLLSIPATFDQTMNWDFATHTATFVLTNHTADKYLRNVALKARFSVPKFGRPLMRALRFNKNLGGPAGMLIASVLTRNLLSREFSIWDCKGSFTQILVGWMSRVIWVTGWSTKEKIELAAGFAGSSAVFWSLGMGATSLASFGILTTSLLVGAGASMLAGFIYDKAKDALTLRGITNALTEYRDPAATDQRRAELAKSLGTMELTSAVVKLPCASEPKPQDGKDAKPRADDYTMETVTEGLFKDYVDLRDARLQEAQVKMDKFVDEKSKPLDEATAEYDRAENPLRPAVDAKKLAFLWAFNNSRKDVAPEEIAVNIVEAILTDPVANKEAGGLDLEKDPDKVDAEFDRYHKEVIQALAAVDRMERLAKHDEVREELRENTERARTKYEAVEKTWARGATEEGEQHLRTLTEIVEEQLKEMKAFDLAGVEKHNPRLVEWLQKRNQALERTVAAYKNTVQFIRSSDKPAPAGPE